MGDIQDPGQEEQIVAPLLRARGQDVQVWQIDESTDEAYANPKQ